MLERVTTRFMLFWVERQVTLVIGVGHIDLRSTLTEAQEQEIKN